MNPPPFHPDTFESLLRRWPAAMAHTVTGKEADDRANRGIAPVGIFDLLDGVRVIASKEDIEGEGVLVHLSFGINTFYHAQWMAKPLGSFPFRVHELIVALYKRGLIGKHRHNEFCRNAMHYWFSIPL